mmetsp:Transcript_15431/g.28071  ORF Transcript_15431/g.28071 Transcript_15431/m.28071 type:complete len:89 (-) Transcript_15431:84-350(-)
MEATLAGVVLGVACGPPAVMLTCGCCLECAGFRGSGVRAGSLAAKWQSAMGNVAKNSCFAFIQACAMSGRVLVRAGEACGAGLLALCS